MIKKAGYYLFAAFFALFRLFPLREDKVFFVATHDDSPEGNAQKKTGNEAVFPDPTGWDPASCYFFCHPGISDGNLGNDIYGQ